MLDQRASAHLKAHLVQVFGAHGHLWRTPRNELLRIVREALKDAQAASAAFAVGESAIFRSCRRADDPRDGKIVTITSTTQELCTQREHRMDDDLAAYGVTLDLTMFNALEAELFPL
jgi:hypothetical protein